MPIEVLEAKRLAVNGLTPNHCLPKIKNRMNHLSLRFFDKATFTRLVY